MLFLSLLHTAATSLKSDSEESAFAALALLSKASCVLACVLGMFPSNIAHSASEVVLICSLPNITSRSQSNRKSGFLPETECYSHYAVIYPTGSLNQNRLPEPGTSVTPRVPPCVSTIDLHIASPSPELPG